MGHRDPGDCSFTFIADWGLPVEQDTKTVRQPVALPHEPPSDAGDANAAAAITAPTAATIPAAATVAKKTFPSANLLKSPGLWIRIAVLTFLVNSTLFFRGCSFEAVNLTTGFPMPAIEFSRGDDGLEFVAMEDVPIMIDLVVCVAGGLLIAALTQSLFFSRAVAAGLLISAAAFNLVLIAPDLWAKTVFQVQVWLLDALFENERRIWVMDIFSRIYFVFHIGVAAGLVALGQRGWRKHIATSSDRWWQFGLTGIFVLTTIACLLTVLALALFFKQ